jgi:cleavage and polyadenylation specificity factor subunit 1
VPDAVALISYITMYSLVRSSHPATGVEHSTSCYFYHAGEKNLVVAGANVLRVFRFVPDLDTRGKEEEQSRLKMECVASWEMFGWIQSLASVRLTGAERDSLLLTFKVRSIHSTITR